MPTHEIPRYPGLTKLSFMFILHSADDCFYAHERFDLLSNHICDASIDPFIGYTTR